MFIADVAQLVANELRSEIGHAVSAEVRVGLRDLMRVGVEIGKSSLAVAKSLDSLSKAWYLYLLRG